jgi:hypothetical protein
MTEALDSDDRGDCLRGRSTEVRGGGGYFDLGHFRWDKFSAIFTSDMTRDIIFNVLVDFLSWDKLYSLAVIFFLHTSCL